MKYEVVTGEGFKKQAKKLIKRYTSLKQEIRRLGQKLKENPTIGTSIGRQCYKIRIAIESKGKGKSGGARIITHTIISQKTVYMLSIYDKSEKESISNEEINRLIANIKANYLKV